MALGLWSDYGKTSLPSARRAKVLASLVLGGFLMMSPAIIYIINPVLVIAKYQTKVTAGSAIFDLLHKEVDAIHVSAYLFNVTNGERFSQGLDAKLKVEEVGPFTYKEMRKNDDLELDEEAGVIRYSPNITPVFVPEESIGDPRDYTVSLPNLAMLSMTSIASDFSFFTRMGYNLMVKQIQSKPIVTMDAYSYLWGYDEPLIKMGNTFLPGWIYFETMGLMDRLYDKKKDYRLEVGARDEDKFKIKSMNGYKGLNAWGYETSKSKCNSFQDSYEGIGYPPEFSAERPVRIYRNVLCRMLDLEFVERRVMEYGVDALVYSISNKTYSSGGDNDCLCGKGVCMEGISDLSPCFYGLPLTVSHAHFLGAPHLREKIEGMRPDKKLHGSEFLIEPNIGAALATVFSIQVNIWVGDVSHNADAKMFSNMAVPVGYFKIVQPPLPKDQKENLRRMYFSGPYMVYSIQLSLFLVGLSLVAYSVKLVYWIWVCSDGRGIAFQIPSDGKETVILGAEKPLLKFDRC